MGARTGSGGGTPRGAMATGSFEGDTVQNEELLEAAAKAIRSFPTRP